jgi:hypothetical protein
MIHLDHITYSRLSGEFRSALSGGGHFNAEVAQNSEQEAVRSG